MTKRAAYADQPYWGRPVPPFGDPRAAASSSSASPRPRTAATAPAATSPATCPRPGCTPRCTAPAWPPRRPPSTPATASGCSAYAWSTRCAAPRRPTSRPPRSRRPARRGSTASSALLLPSVRAVVCLGAIGWNAAWSALGRVGLDVPRPRAAVRPRRRGADRRPDGARLLPPLAAQHLHRPTHRGDVRRRPGPRPPPLRLTRWLSRDAGRPRWLSSDAGPIPLVEEGCSPDPAG